MATAAERGHWTRTLGGVRGAVEEAEDAPPAPKALRWHAGTDLGLLTLRLVLGGVFIGHGVRKLASGFGGQGLGGLATVLAENGFHQPTVLAWLDAAVELAGGVLVLLGAATPLVAAALLGLMLNAVWIRLTGAGLPPDGGRGLELALVLAGAAAALVFTGGGRLALDRRLRFFRRPAAAVLPCLLLGLGLAVAVRLLLHG